MTTIKEIAEKVREGNLTLSELEDYFIMLNDLAVKFELRMAEIEKEEAVFLNTCDEKTRSNAEKKFNQTESGLEKIDLKHNIRALSKLTSSVKIRLFK